MMSDTNGMSSAGSLIGGAGCALVMLGIAWSPELAAQEQELPVIRLPPAEAVFPNKRFSWIKSVRELSDGRLLVSDQIERALYVVDFQSGGIRTIGTIGEGPGEYQWPGFLYALAGDSTLFTDESRHKWFLMVGDSIVGILERDAMTPVLLRVGSPLGADRSGRVLVVEGFAHAPGVPPIGRTQADSVRILRSTGRVVNSRAGIEAGRFDTIAELGGQGLAGVLVERGLTPLQGISQLATEGLAWLFGDGWIAVAHPEPYRVDWRTPDGRWILGPRLPFTPVEVTRDEKCFRLSRVTLYTECRLDQFSVKWPKHMPAFLRERLRTTAPSGTALRPAPGGMLLVLRTPTLEAPGNRYDVIDRTGALRGVFRLPVDQTIVGFGPSSLYVVRRNAVDLQTLSRHPWRLGPPPESS